MHSEAVAALVEAMRAGGGSRAETFFISQGLGAAYHSVGRGYGIQKHVNAAILQAEREDRREEVLRAGLTAYGLDLPASGNEERVGPAIARQANSTGRLFISHASADKDLADALADLLRLGTDLPSDRIICTSLEGMGIPTGTTNYLEFLRAEISDAGLVLPLLTPAFFDSEVCLIEIGAMWGLSQPAFPIIVPPVDYARVERLLGKFQSGTINQKKGLSELRDRIAETFGLRHNTPMWDAKYEQFEAKLPTLLDGLAEGTRVPAADLANAKAQALRLKTKVRLLEKELLDLRSQLAEVAAAKTREQLDAATLPRGNTIQAFKAAAKVAQNALERFAGGVREAFYEELGRGALYRPEQYSSRQEEAEVALRDDLLGFDDDNGGYYLNTDDPQIDETVRAINALFDREWSDNVATWFMSTYKKRLSVEVRATWVALDLL